MLLFFAGLSLLVFSSNYLIQGSVKLSKLFKLTPLFVGMIIIAFGTSAPEAAVGIMAAIRGQKGIALGNIIGSNISNIGLILGLCAVLRPLSVNKSIFKREIPAMLFSVILFYVLCLDLCISRIDGLIFISMFIIFCVLSYRRAKKSYDSDEVKNFKLNKWLEGSKSRSLALMITVFSLVGVVVGADFMVRAGSSLAKSFGISPWTIGITVFAIGTSLPELVTSLTAFSRKVPSIGVGNILGSNIFNILFVLGVVSLIRPINIDSSILRFELPVLLLFSGAFFITIRTGYKISRVEGAAMLLGYIFFIFFLLK